MNPGSTASGNRFSRLAKRLLALTSRRQHWQFLRQLAARQHHGH